MVKRTIENVNAIVDIFKRSDVGYTIVTDKKNREALISCIEQCVKAQNIDSNLKVLKKDYKWAYSRISQDIVKYVRNGRLLKEVTSAEEEMNSNITKQKDVETELTTAIENAINAFEAVKDVVEKATCVDLETDDPIDEY